MLPKAPAGMAPDARRVYGQITRVLADANILDAADGWCVEAAAVMLTRARTAAADVAARGLLVERERCGRDGERTSNLEPNPSVKLERDAWLGWLRFAEQMGLTPAMRAKLANAGADVGQGLAGLPGLGELRAIKGGLG